MKIKDAVTRNFSRYAGLYDRYSAVQDYLGAELISSINADCADRILDIGCGTGNYTRLLRSKFPRAAIMAVDICGKMIEVAKIKLKHTNIDFLAIDAEAMKLSCDFDLITSNACFQWLGDLDSAISNFRNMLNNKGIILFSIFGPETFTELSRALKQLYKREITIASKNFVDAEAVEKILKNNFSNVTVENHIFKKSYSSLLELLRTIKYTGTQGAGLNGKALNRDSIGQLEKIYKNQFGEITATYQVFYCKAEKGA